MCVENLLEPHLVFIDEEKLAILSPLKFLYRSLIPVSGDQSDIFFITLFLKPIETHLLSQKGLSYLSMIIISFIVYIIGC